MALGPVLTLGRGAGAPGARGLDTGLRNSRPPGGPSPLTPGACALWPGSVCLVHLVHLDEGPPWGLARPLALVCAERSLCRGGTRVRPTSCDSPQGSRVLETPGPWAGPRPSWGLGNYLWVMSVVPAACQTRQPR